MSSDSISSLNSSEYFSSYEYVSDCDSSSLTTNSDFSNILQVDGLMDSPYEASLCTRNSSTSQHQQIKRVPYNLDSNKQLSRLHKDTEIEDFTITVSPIAHNVNIKCSSGFYSEVVLAAFSQIFINFQHQIDRVKIICSKITFK